MRHILERFFPLLILGIKFASFTCLFQIRSVSKHRHNDYSTWTLVKESLFMKKKIKSYWHHASLDDDITSLGAISSSVQLIMLHIMAWNGRTDRPSEKPTVCLSTTCPLHSQTLEVTLVFKHTLVSLFFTTGLKVYSDNWLPLQKSHAQSGTNVTAGNFHAAVNIKWAGWIWLPYCVLLPGTQGCIIWCTTWQ